MDLFRRIFGKTSDEMPTESTQSSKPNTPPAELAPKATEEPGATTELPAWDDIDPKTRPVDVAVTKTLPSDGVTAPLSSDTVNANTSLGAHIVFGQSTDVGLVRNNNQDSIMSFLFTSGSADDYPEFGLFVVADGMGGHHDGEKASALTAKTITSNITKSVYLPLISGTGLAEVPPISEALIEAVQNSNSEVIDQVPDGGTTVTAVAIMGDLAYVAHVGDSRAYLMTSEGIEQITRDHSLVQRLIELNQLTREEAETHPQKNVLYRALGQNESVEVDTLSRRLPRNSRLLLCSDGLWGLVEERHLYEITMNTPDPQEACDRLVALAKTHGGIDNVSAVLIKIS